MKKRLAALALATLLAACETTPKVAYDADPSAQFNTYRTYSWAYNNAPQGVNPLLVQRIKASIDSTLAQRGYSQAEASDFAVGFTIGSRDRVEVTQMGGYGPYYRPWGGWGGMGWGASTMDVRNVTDGTLVIDIYDAKTKAPVWHGTATQEITSKSLTDEKIGEAVSAVLANFPPPAK